MTLHAPRTLREFPRLALNETDLSIRFPAEGIDTLVVDWRVLGNLLICFDAGKEASFASSCEAHLLPERVECADGTMLVKGNNLSAYLLRQQRRKIVSEVHVPPHTRIDIRFTAGAVVLNGGTGGVSIKGKFGEAAGITHAARVDVSLRVGDISLNELTGDAAIRVGLGSAALGWTKLHGSERVRARCGFGGVDLLLPPGVAETEKRGGFRKERHISVASGTSIKAKIGYGSLDTLDWGR